MTTNKCMNCGATSTTNAESMRNMLMDKCYKCTKTYKGQILRNNYWWDDGTPIGHEQQMTKEQFKHTTSKGATMSNKCIIERSDGKKLFAEDVNDDMIQSIIKSDSCKVIYNDEEYDKAMNIPIITGDSDTDELLEDEREQ